MRREWLNLIPGQRSSAGGGESVPGTGHEDRCALAITAIVEGRGLTEHFSDPLIVAPGFVHAMMGSEPIFPYGKAALMRLNSGGREIMFLCYRVAGDERSSCLGANEVREFLRGFGGQQAQPATREQRALYYALIPFEIAGEPVSVIQDGKRCLLLQATDKGVLWIDMIDEYPLRPVARNLEDALKLVERINARRQ